MREKIILDTDIGSDIDDAACLAYLLAQPQCDLLGVTTVSGEAAARASMASVLCKIAGRDTPIHAGVEQPLLIEPRQPHAQQAKVLPNWPHKTDFPPGEAIEFLRRTIRANPGEVTLLAIGPMTNVALLLASDPSAAGLLKRLVLMCGYFGDGFDLGRKGVEWNAYCDPHAAAVVYRATPRTHWSVGLDVTTKVTMHKDEVRQRFTHPLLKPVLDFAGVWFERSDKITFHDPLAAALIFEPSLCTFDRGRIEIDLSHTDQLGRTRLTRDSAGPHEAAMTVNASRFFEHYFGVFD